MLDYKKTEEALSKFGAKVVQEAKKNAAKQNYKGKLSNSLEYVLNTHRQSFSLGFKMEKYGLFIDRGVRGSKSSYIEARRSEHKYTNKRPPMQPLMEWAKAKRIRLRDEKGRFKKGNYRAIGFILQRSIFEKGIRPSFFFTKPFEQYFKRLPDDLVESFALDIENFYKYSLNK